MIDEKKPIEDILQYENVLAPANHICKIRYRDRQDETIDIIDSQPKVGEWIPVSERLPDNADEDVLITVNGTYKNITYEDAIMLAVYDKDEGWIIDGYEYWLTAQVTAWQPLPEPYKGESE